MTQIRTVNSGQKYGHVTAIKIVRERSQSLDEQWLCTCECGASVLANRLKLLKNPKYNCGCVFREELRQRMQKHGHTQRLIHATGNPGVIASPTYQSWTAMKHRCLNPNHAAYHRYGGRGITICDEWLSFECFLKDMGERPEGTSLERINNDASYCKSNCCWASTKQQTRNRCNSRLYEAFGKSLTLPEWSAETGIHKSTLYHRFAKGLSIEEALSKPVRPKRPDARASSS